MTLGTRKAGMLALIAILFCTAAAMVRAAQTQSAPTRSVSGRVIMESGVLPQRFTLPMSSPGKAAAAAAITPQPDGTFQITLPIGMSVVGAPANLPTGTTVLGLTFGGTDLMKEPLVLDASGNAQLLVTLRGPRPVSVSGRVTGLASTNGVLIVLQNRASAAVLRGGASAESIETLLGPDGTFSATNVSPGSYLVRVIGGFVEKSMTITLGGSDLTDVNIAMPQENYVTGLVIVEDYDGPVPAVTAEARTAEGRVVASTAPTAYDGKNTGQFIVFRLINGEYRISLRAVPEGYRVKSVTYGTLDLAKDSLKLDGNAFWNIVVRLTRAGA